MYICQHNNIYALGSNPNKDAPCIEVEFDRFSPTTVAFPDAAQVEEYGRFITSLSTTTPLMDLAKCDPSQVESLREIQAKDPLSELSEQEKDLLWQMRMICCKKVPDALPKLLDAVKWNNRDEVSQVIIIYLFTCLHLHSTKQGFYEYSCSFSCLCGLQCRPKRRLSCSIVNMLIHLCAN